MSQGGMRVKKVMTQAINLIFEFLKNVRPHLARIYGFPIRFLKNLYYIRKKEFKYGCTKIHP